MGLLDKILQDDAAATADLDGDGETIEYVAGGIGSAILYSANVLRFIPEVDPMSQAPAQGPIERIEIELPNDGARGPASIDRGKDVFRVARRKGEALAPHTGCVIVNQGAGFWRLRLR